MPHAPGLDTMAGILASLPPEFSRPDARSSFLTVSVMPLAIKVPFMGTKKDIEGRSDKAAEKKNESEAMRRANLAGEIYASPEEASPAYAPAEPTAPPEQREEGVTTDREKKARMIRRANIAGEVYDTPRQ